MERCGSARLEAMGKSIIRLRERKPSCPKCHVQLAEVKALNGSWRILFLPGGW